jgi:hypothetical protein
MLHVIAYPAMLNVSRDLIRYVARLLRNKRGYQEGRQSADLLDADPLRDRLPSFSSLIRGLLGKPRLMSTQPRREWREKCRLIKGRQPKVRST